MADRMRSVPRLAQAAAKGPPLGLAMLARIMAGLASDRAEGPDFLFDPYRGSSKIHRGSKRPEMGSGERRRMRKRDRRRRRNGGGRD